MTLLKDGENALSEHGASTLIGRDGNRVQILITCATEEEAKRLIERAMEDVRTTGKMNLFFRGSVDETEIARAKQ